jgi:hypothetical protein
VQKTIVAVSSLLVCWGCASIEPIPIKGPNGRDGYTMRCSGAGRTLEACYQKAGEVCPRGYNVVSQDASTVAFGSGGNLYAAPQRNLTVECR